MTADKQVTNTNKATDLSIPMNLKAKVEDDDKLDGKVVFSLITRKGNKTNAKALQVPEDSRLANGLKKAEEERIKQRQDIKKHTIDLANRQRIEEVQQEILGNVKSPTQNRNHERAKKYTHPKAPPNADIIFSAGGRRK
jgi:regulator of nonsense transcripts 2